MEDSPKEVSSPYSIMCPESPPITATATTATKPPINQLLPKFRPRRGWMNSLGEGNETIIDDSSSYSSGLTTVGPEPPTITTPAATSPYTTDHSTLEGEYPRLWERYPRLIGFARRKCLFSLILPTADPRGEETKFRNPNQMMR